MRILIISENRAVASEIEQQLQIKNLETETVYSGEIGEEYAELGIYDLLILDSELSERSAYEISRSLRIKHCRMPIILLVQRYEVEDRIKGMKSGVDYFLLQPYDVRELLASVDALLQRITDQAEEPYYGNTRLVLASGKLVSGDQSTRLSAKEFEVMRLLLQAKDRLLSKEVILARVWGYDSNAVENHVEVYVGFLRKKLRSIGSNLEIKAVRRMGYTLEIREET
ncbi:MAG: response regulator transcription factor [Oscillospiraceae bacterium]|nr:response regulator transcription factor [Oscillospiraceae bacterium]